MPHYYDDENNVLYWLDPGSEHFKDGFPGIVREIDDDEAASITAKNAPVRTEAELIDGIRAAVTGHLDSAARAKNYDNIQSAAIRAGFPGPFHDEGVAFAVWMDACWAKCYQLLAEVKGGTRAVMSADEVVAELPHLVLP